METEYFGGLQEKSNPFIKAYKPRLESKFSKSVESLNPRVILPVPDAEPAIRTDLPNFVSALLARFEKGPGKLDRGIILLDKAGLSRH